MKKITLILSLSISLFINGQNDTAILGNQTTTSLKEATTQNTSRVPTFFFDLIQFETNAGALTTENFEGGATGGTNTCGVELSAAGDNCFPINELEVGFKITSSTDANINLVNTGTYSNQTIELIGSSEAVGYTIITFDEPIYEYGIVLFNTTADFTDIRAYGPDGSIQVDSGVFTDLSQEFFVGTIEDQPIIRLEIEGENNSMELFGSLSFTAPPASDGTGACGENNTSNNLENGLPYNAGQDFAQANDITVAPGEDFELQQIVYNSYHQPGETIASVDVTFLKTAGGFPGEPISEQLAVVPTSQTFLELDAGSGFAVSEITLDVTPILLEGRPDVNTTYWVRLSKGISSSGGELFWEVSSNAVNGNAHVVYDEEIQLHNVFRANLDGVYTWNGECASLSLEETSIKELSLYPNPSSDFINITAENQIETVEIYNMTGQKVYDQILNTNTGRLNISKLTPGMYLVQVSINGQYSTQSILKK